MTINEEIMSLFFDKFMKNPKLIMKENPYSELMDLAREDERKKQTEGLCTICSKKDEFSKSMICHECITEREELIIKKAYEKGCADTKEKIKELILRELKVFKENLDFGHFFEEIMKELEGNKT